MIAMTTNSSMSVNASRLTVFHLLYLLQHMSICNAYGYSNTIGQRMQPQIRNIGGHFRAWLVCSEKHNTGMSGK